jgi:hypothetical protein
MPDNTMSDEQKTQVFGMHFLQDVELEADDISGGGVPGASALKNVKRAGKKIGEAGKKNGFSCTIRETGVIRTDCVGDTD